MVMVKKKYTLRFKFYENIMMSLRFVARTSAKMESFAPIVND